MIQIEDLRVGNHFLLNDEIIKLDGGTLILVIENEIKIKPIELTEELLLKCGCQKFGDGLYDLSIFEFGFFCFDEKGLFPSFQSQPISTHLKYLHEFQNYINSSTKTNLTINL